MSFSGEEARSFFVPLSSKTATFLLDGRQANVNLAATIATLAAGANRSMTIFDLDALYSSHANKIFASLDDVALRSTTIMVPKPGSDIEGEFSRLFEAPQSVVIIDSLNSLFHLLSLDDGSSRGRKLAFSLEGLSYFSRTNSKVVILTMYRREGFSKSGTDRSISHLSDITVSVGTKGSEISFRSLKGPTWPGGVFLTRNPSG